MWLLLGLVFLPLISYSLAIFAGFWHPPAATPARLVRSILFEITLLISLWAVLASQNRNLLSIGFSPIPKRSDIGNSLLLFFGSFILTLIAHWIIWLAYLTATGRGPAAWRGQSMVFGATITVLPFLMALVNPFFEELLVRAFLITEIEEKFGSTKLAAITSIAVQASYHLYQGVANALAVAVIFSIFTVFYVRTRRILPVILAHMYLDLYAVTFYALSLRRVG